MGGRLADLGDGMRLSEGWNLVLTEAGTCLSPSDVPLALAHKRRVQAEGPAAAGAGAEAVA